MRKLSLRSIAALLTLSCIDLLAVGAVSAQPPTGPGVMATDLPEPLPPLLEAQPIPAPPESPLPPQPTGPQFAPDNPATERRTLPTTQPTTSPRPTPVPARQAIGRTNAPLPSRNASFRLARAPKMLGDFFGQSFASGEGDLFFGRGVHHITAIGDIHRIDEPNEPGSVVTYAGGPNGDAPGSFLLPPVAAPAPAYIDDLTSNIPGVFFAVRTNDTVDVFNSPMDTTPDIAGAAVYDIFQEMTLVLPAAGPGDIIGRARLQDNNSALPQDRVYLDYSYFHNARLAPGGVGVNRFAPGLEKTFGNGIGSFEVRVPMGMTINSTQMAGMPFDTSNYEFGNTLVTTKVVLFGDDSLICAAGLGVALPTADDLVVNSMSGGRMLEVQNDSVHLQPYLAALYTPEGTSAFVHAFLTFDFDTAGNATYADTTGAGLTRLGTWQDQNLVSLNLGLGSWIYQNQCSDAAVEGVAWSAELHYTSTISDADVLATDGLILGNEGASLSVLNGTIGAHARIRQTIITAGYSVPLNSDQRVFDGEVRAFINRMF